MEEGTSIPLAPTKLPGCRRLQRPLGLLTVGPAHTERPATARTERTPSARHPTLTRGSHHAAPPSRLLLLLKLLPLHGTRLSRTALPVAPHRATAAATTAAVTIARGVGDHLQVAGRRRAGRRLLAPSP